MSEPAKSRRAAREAAFQAAYQCSIGHVSITAACQDMFARKEFDDESKLFIQDLANGMVTQTGVLDDTYSHFLKPGWNPDRLAVSDLLVLRMAIVEFYDYPEIPPKVTIVEAINIAKKFGTEESGKLINGVLAKVLAESPKKDWPIIDAMTTEVISEDLEIPIVPEDTPIEEEPYFEASEEVPYIEVAETPVVEPAIEEIKIEETKGWQLKSDD